MNKAFNNFPWENYPSDKSPINEVNLMKINNGLDEVDNRVITHETTKATKTEVAPLIKEIEFNESNGIFTITRKNGSKFTIDTKLEKIAINFGYDPVTQKISLTLIDGTVQYIDLSALITQYEFMDTDTVSFFVDTNGKVSAIVKDGSITEDKLQPNYLAEIKVESAKAEAAATAADASKVAAAGSASTAATKAGEAATSAADAANSAAASDASKTAAAGSASTAATKAGEAATSAENAFLYADAAGNYNASAATNASAAAKHANRAEEKANAAASSATSADTYAKQAQSYAVGTGGVRPNEATDNAKYYYEQSKDISQGLAGALMPMGTVTFANLPTLADTESGWMYNVSNQFTTTADFKEGVGNVIPAGANVYKTADGKWDILAGTPVTGIKGNAETSYRKGNVNLTPANIGALASDGNAVSASKWSTARNVNGMILDGTQNRFNYGTCSTAAGTTAKTVACTGFSLITGAEITVKFIVADASVKPTLNVNNTGAKPIYYRGSNIKSGYLSANGTYSFRYNGSQWDLVGEIDTSVNTWKANTKDSEGYVTKGYGQANKVWKTDSDGNPAWRDEGAVSAVTGVKGNAESAYRTGNINISPANIGLGNVDNTADANKSVNYANSAGDADTVDGMHGWQLGTLDEEGIYNGQTNPCYCRYNLFGDGRFGLYVGGFETRVHYATFSDISTSTVFANSVRDSGDNTSITLAYSKPGIESADYFAAWNGYELRGMHKNSVVLTIGAVRVTGDTLRGHLNASEDNKWILGGESKNWLNVYTRNIESSTGTLSVKSKEDNLYLCSRVNIKCVPVDGSNGYIYIIASAFNVASSIRVKENVEEMTAEEARKILSVEVVTFDYIAQYGGHKNQRGVIAEDVYKILPSVVSMPTGYDENGEGTEDVPCVDYSKFVPYLIKMVQIQQNEIEDLKEKNQKIEERLARLEALALV